MTLESLRLPDGKKWRDSWTMRGVAIVAVLEALQQAGVLPQGTAAGVDATVVSGLDAWDSILVFATNAGQLIGGVLAVFGLRKAATSANATNLILVAMVLPGAAWSTACATYDRGTLLALADANEPRATLDAEECDAFRAASDALRSGPDKAVKGIGRGDALEPAADRVASQAGICDEAVGRGEAFTATRRTAEAFSATWREIREVAR